MAASPIKELYVSPNGDRWILGESQGGELVVCHHPNKRSGGAPSEIALDVFLSHGGQGPEYQALAEALANLEVAGKKPDHKILAEETQKLDLALGIMRKLTPIGASMTEALANLEVAGKKHPTIRYFRPKQSRNWITLLEKLWHGAGVA